MALSNYPNGFKDGVSIRGVPITLTHPGQVFWVNGSTVLAEGAVAGADTTSAGTYQRPFATIDYAIGQCTASRGDIIVVMPGHTETVSAAGGITADIAGVAIIGLGTGSLRPTITLDTATTATVTVNAANVTFKNLIFSAGFADIAEVFTPTAKFLTIEGCRFEESVATENFLSIMDTGTTNNQCDGFALIDCEWISPDTATLSACTIDADLDGLTIEGCYMNLGVNTNDLPILAAVATGKDLTNLKVEGNTLIRLNDANALLITADTTTANTGSIKNNSVRHLVTTSEILVTAGTNISFTNNLCSAVVDKSGYVLPAADA